MEEGYDRFIYLCNSKGISSGIIEIDLTEYRKKEYFIESKI
jgi:hypothetical protein